MKWPIKRKITPSMGIGQWTERPSPMVPCLIFTGRGHRGDSFMTSRKAFEAMFGASPKEEYARITSHLVGESHMRYYWDFFYYLYYGSSALGQFDRKHGYTAHIPHLVHEGVLFATDMGDYFARQQCPPQPIRSYTHSNLVHGI